MAIELNKLEFDRAISDTEDGFRFYCKYVRIVDKKAKLVRFELNHVQNLLIEEFFKPKVRLMILKCRQRGVTTLATQLGLKRAITIPNKRGAVYLHRFPPTRELGRKCQVTYNHLPMIFKNPKLDTVGISEVNISELNSTLKFVTAGQRGAASRSETLDFLHLSEPAFYESLTETLTAARDSVPDEDGTYLVLESTPNTISDPFAKLWFASKAGLSEFKTFFYPWHADPEAIIIDNDLYEPWEGSDEENLAQRKYELTIPQLKWRRKAIQKYVMDGEGGSALKIFKREHPESDTDCFMADQCAFFPTEVIQDHIGRVEIDTREGQITPQKGINFFTNPEMRVLLKDAIIFKDVEHGRRYALSGDTSEGIDKGDFQAGIVLDLDSGEQCAQINTKVDVYTFTKMLNVLGRYYNDAILAVEFNNHGIAVVEWLVREFNYPNLYRSTTRRNLGTGQRHVSRYGFYTTSGLEVNTKRYIMDNLSQSLTAGEILPMDKTCLEQLLHYQEKDRRLSAPEGMFDDLVMALAIAWNCRSQNTSHIDIFTSRISQRSQDSGITLHLNY
ncbi:hypothetical protein M0R01_03710 [bacterium]|nr:hypothetical protein [bacterium]